MQQLEAFAFDTRFEFGTLENFYTNSMASIFIRFNILHIKDTIKSTNFPQFEKTIRHLLSS